MALRVSPTLTLPEAELVERFVRASGPGGQNVNKVATAVELRFDATASSSLPERAKRQLRRVAPHLVTQDGVLIIQADRYRSQARNREDARDRLVDILREALAPPPKPRIPTRPSLGAKRRRLEAKARRSVVKKGRGRPDL
ncbi:MAG: alternative ribosome rescue aminoacyl-tRNA hydrolase ArfB [Pseudomonadota bacterium]